MITKVLVAVFQSIDGKVLKVYAHENTYIDFTPLTLVLTSVIIGEPLYAAISCFKEVSKFKKRPLEKLRMICIHIIDTVT